MIAYMGHYNATKGDMDLRHYAVFCGSHHLDWGRRLDRSLD